MDFFKVKLKYRAYDENGAPKRKNDVYIVEAFNCSDAEATITELVETYGFMEAEISGMDKVKFSDIFEDKDGVAEIWYKVKYTLITVDEAGKEKRYKMDVLVQASTIDDALKKFKAQMTGTASDWASIAVQETPIVDVIKKSLKN